MAKTQATFQKRQKELARLERRKEKEAKRLEKKAEGDTASTAAESSEDPDLAGIRLGPQPRAHDDEAYDGVAESERGR